MAGNIRDAIRDKLLNTTAVSGVTTTIRPAVLQQGDKPPAVLIKVLSNNPQEWLNDSQRIYRARVAVQAYGTDASKSDDLAKRIREQALSPLFKGLVSGINIREISLEMGPLDSEDQPKDGSDDWLRHVRQDFQITYYSQ